MPLFKKEMQMQGIKDLTHGPIGRQLFNLATPIMATSFIQMAYSLTDMAWVGRIGSEAIAAVGAVGVLTWMTGSIALLNKVGSEVSVAQSIGSQNADDARSFASHNTTMALLISLFWGGLLFTLAPFVIGFYELKAPIAANAVSFLRIITTAFPFVFLSATFTGVYNAAGRSKVPFLINVVGLGLNIVLDPLFIFGLGLGVQGAAYATWLSQGLVLAIFVFNLRGKSAVLGGFPFLTRLRKRYSLRIFKLGFPVAMFNTLFSFISMFLCRTASAHGGHIGLMAFTTGGQIEAIAWNTSQGFSTALSTFIAQNYAAGKRERVLQGLYTILRLAAVFGVLITILFIGFGDEVFSIFVPEPEAYRAGGTFLRIDAYSMLFMMLEITMQGVFYGMGRTVPPAVVSICFTTMRIPLALLLVHLGMGVEGIWWAVSISSIVKGVVLGSWFLFVGKKALLVNKIGR